MREFFLLSGKPTIFACNVAEADLANVVAIVEAARENEGVKPSENVNLRRRPVACRQCRIMRARISAPRRW